MSQLIVEGFGAEAYLEALRDVIPCRWPKSAVRDLVVRTAYARMQEPAFGEMVCGADPWDAILAESELEDQVYGALPMILVILWPLLQPLVVEIIRRLFEYWRGRPEAVQAIQSAARGGS